MSGHSQSSNGAESPIKGMRSATIHNSELAGQLTALWAVVSSAVQSILKHSASEAF
jgi:hypothetical protein